jgi:hypothetical protein
MDQSVVTVAGRANGDSVTIPNHAVPATASAAVKTDTRTQMGQAG